MKPRRTWNNRREPRVFGLANLGCTGRDTGPLRKFCKLPDWARLDCAVGPDCHEPRSLLFPQRFGLRLPIPVSRPSGVRVVRDLSDRIYVFFELHKIQLATPA